MRIALCSYSQKEKETALLMKLGKVDRFDNGVFWYLCHAAGWAL